jgi:hypothetical protein
MTKSLTYEEFVFNLESFLKEEKAYDKFINNLTKNNKKLIDIYYPNCFYQFIIIAFIWSTTNEGLKYWTKLNSKLRFYKIKELNYDECWND